MEEDWDPVPFWKKKEFLIPAAIVIAILIIVPPVVLISVVNFNDDSDNNDADEGDGDGGDDDGDGNGDGGGDGGDDDGNGDGDNDGNGGDDDDGGDGGGNDTNPFERFIWESMEGPPGGDIQAFVQDPGNPGTVYAGATMGLYKSTDNGKDFDKVPNSSHIRNFTSIRFHEDFLIIEADRIHTYDPDRSIFNELADGKYLTCSHEEKVYFLDVTWDPDSFHAYIWEETISSPDQDPSLDDSTLIVDSEVEMRIKDNPLTSCFINVTRFLRTGNDFLFMVMIQHDDDFAYDFDRHEIFHVDRAEGNIERTTPDFGERHIPLVIEKDPENEKHLLVGARSKLPNDDFGRRSLRDMLKRSNDGGKTWSRVDINYGQNHSVIKDIEFHENHVYVSRFGDHIIKFDSEDPNDFSTIPMPVFGDVASNWMEWLEFDLGNPDRVYGQLDSEFGSRGFLLSEDGMKTWNFIGGGIPNSLPSNIAMHPTNSNIMATSGNIAHLPYITKNFGDSWNLLHNGTTMADELKFDPHDPNHLLMITETSDNYESWDMGGTWQRSAEEFSATRIFDLEATETGSSSIYASLNGIGVSRIQDLDRLDEYIQSGEAVHEWKHLFRCPDYAYDLELEPGSSEVLYTTYSPKIFENHSSIWRYDSSKEENFGWRELLKVDKTSGATSVVVDPTDKNRIYTGITGDPGRIYFTDDRGDSWEILNEDLTFSTIHELAVDPSDQKTVYAAPWGGGLFRSTDSASTWTELDVPTSSISSILIDPDDSSRIIIGDRTAPRVYESRDGGISFELIVEFDIDMVYRVSDMILHNNNLYVSLFNIQEDRISLYRDGPMSGTTFRMDESGPVELGGEMKRAVIDFVSDGSNLFAASHVSGVYKLNGNNWENITGDLPDMGFNEIVEKEGTLYLAGGCDVGMYGSPRIDDPEIVNSIYMSANGGDNWIPLMDDDPFNGPVKCILPMDDSRLLAATQTGVYISTNGGTTWNPKNTGLDFRSIGSFAAGSDRIYAGTLGGGVYGATVTQSNEVNWKDSTGPNPHISNIQIKIDPNDSDTLYATAFPGGVFKSTDKGSTWSEYNFALPSFEIFDPVIEGYYSLEIDPDNSSNLYLGIYEHGVYVSRDGANTWFPMYALSDVGNHFNKLNVKRVAIDPSNTSNIYLVSDEGAYRSLDSGRTWEDINDGLGTLDILSIDITENGRVFAGTNGYGVYRFNKDSKNWTHLKKPLGEGKWAAWDRRLYQYSAILFDPNVEGRIYLGQFPGGFFISEDNGASWKCSSLGLGNDGIFSLVMHPEDPKTLFAGTYNGIWKSTDQGRTWTNSSGGMPGEQWPFCVVIDPGNPSVMYTATKNGMNMGFPENNVFWGVVMKSTNGGESWNYIMNNLSNRAEYYQLIIHPDNSSVLFLSSMEGVYISTDAGNSWHPINNGLPEEGIYMRDNVADNMDITPDKKHLILCLPGFGVWKMDISEFINT